MESMISTGPTTPGWPGPSSPCLSILSIPRWVSRLVTAKTKYTLAQQAVPDKEEGNEAILGWELGSVGGGPHGVVVPGARAPVWDHWELGP